MFETIYSFDVVMASNFLSISIGDSDLTDVIFQFESPIPMFASKLLFLVLKLLSCIIFYILQIILRLVLSNVKFQVFHILGSLSKS